MADIHDTAKALALSYLAHNPENSTIDLARKYDRIYYEILEELIACGKNRSKKLKINPDNLR